MNLVEWLAYEKIPVAANVEFDFGMVKVGGMGKWQDIYTDLRRLYNVLCFVPLWGPWMDHDSNKYRSLWSSMSRFDQADEEETKAYIDASPTG